MNPLLGRYFEEIDWRAIFPEVWVKVPCPPSVVVSVPSYAHCRGRLRRFDAIATPAISKPTCHGCVFVLYDDMVFILTL